jgi:hypothetical protein
MFTDDKCVTVWRDNKPVYTASNSYSGVSSERVRRWNRQEREYIDLPIPRSVAKYNKGMGGVDLLDAMVAKYRGRVRRNNWFVGVTAVNAWRLMRVNQDPDLPYLKFLRGLVMEVLSKHGKKKERTGCQGQGGGQPQERCRPSHDRGLQDVQALPASKVYWQNHIRVQQMQCRTSPCVLRFVPQLMK